MTMKIINRFKKLDLNYCRSCLVEYGIYIEIYILKQCDIWCEIELAMRPYPPGQVTSKTQSIRHGTKSVTLQ